MPRIDLEWFLKDGDGTCGRSINDTLTSVRAGDQRRAQVGVDVIRTVFSIVLGDLKMAIVLPVRVASSWGARSYPTARSLSAIMACGVGIPGVVPAV